MSKLLHQNSYNKDKDHEFLKESKHNGICINCKGGVNIEVRDNKRYCKKCGDNIGFIV